MSGHCEGCGGQGECWCDAKPHKHKAWRPKHEGASWHLIVVEDEEKVVRVNVCEECSSLYAEIEVKYAS